MEKIGRNEPCPCGSGKKYKKCCYQKDYMSDEILLSKDFGRNLPKDAVITTGPQKEKMSEVLLEFAEPLTAACEDDGSFYNALSISAIAWNASLFPSKEKTRIDDTINENITNKEAKETTKEILLKMVRRKEQDFPDIKRMIIDFQVSYKDGARHLHVISSPVNEQHNGFGQQSGKL